jgi:hypothetical protein
MARPEQPTTIAAEKFKEKINAQEASLLPNLKWPTLGNEKQRRYFHALHLHVLRRFQAFGIETEDILSKDWIIGAPTPKAKAIGKEFWRQWEALLILFGKPGKYPFFTKEANRLAGFRNAPDDPIEENAGEIAIRKAIKQLCDEFSFNSILKIFKKSQQRLAFLVSATCDFKRCNRTTVAKIFRKMRSDKEI